MNVFECSIFIIFIPNCTKCFHIILITYFCKTIDHFHIEIIFWPNNMKHKPLVTLKMIPISLFGLNWFWQHWPLCYNVLEYSSTFDAFIIDLLIYRTYIVLHISPFIILYDEMAYVFLFVRSKIWQHLQALSLAIFYDPL
jgi:hypothetical protein